MSTNDLIAESRWHVPYAGSPDDDWCIHCTDEWPCVTRRLADALEAATRERDAATEAHDPKNLSIMNGWLVEEVDEHTCGTGPDGYYGAHEPGCGYEPHLNLADLEGWPGAERAAATGNVQKMYDRACADIQEYSETIKRLEAEVDDWQEGWIIARLTKAEADRDAALAAVERARATAISIGLLGKLQPGDHSEILSAATKDILAALDGAPEPEDVWEYQWGEPGESFEGFDSFATEELARAEMELDSYYSSHRVMRRRKAGPWLPVEGEKP